MHWVYHKKSIILLVLGKYSVFRRFEIIWEQKREQ